MRRQRLLRTSSAQSVCIFCACRIAGELPAAASRPFFLTQQTRGIANTRPIRQAPATSLNNDTTNPNSPAWTGFDAKSSLSASEQREKAILRQRREAAESKVREPQERRVAAERARRDAEDKRRWEQDQARLMQNRQPGYNVRHNDRARDRRDSGPRDRGNTVRERKSFWRQEEVAERPVVRKFDSAKGIAQTEQTQRSARDDFQNRVATSARPPRQPRESRGAVLDKSGKFQANQPRKKDSRPEAPPKKAAMPSFSAASKPTQAPEPVTSGWGSGASKAQIDEDAAPVHNELREAREPDPAPNRNIRERSALSDLEGFGFGAGSQPRSRRGQLSARYAESMSAGPDEPQQWAISRPPPTFDRKEPSDAETGWGQRSHVQSDAQSIQDVLESASGVDERDGRRTLFPRDEDGSGAAREPQRPARRNDYRTNGNNGYRVSPFNPEDYNSSRETAQEAPESNWKHLSNRRIEPEPQQQRPPPPPPPQRSQYEDVDEVDRLFAQHREQRQSYTAPPPPPARPSQPEPTYQAYAPPVLDNREAPAPSPYDDFALQRPDRDAPNLSNVTCARCKEVGHHARQCPGPKCYVCGKTGHIGRLCPTKTNQPASARRVQSSDFGNGERDVETEAPARRSRYEPEEEERPARASRFGEDRPARRESDDPRQLLMARMRESQDEDAEPEERVLKSRKFRDEEPEKKKPGRRRRDDDEDDYDTRPRRGRRDIDDEEEGGRSRKSDKRAEREAQKKAERATERAALQAEKRNQIKLPEFVSVQNLAQALNVRYEVFVSRLEDLGYDDIFPGKILNTEVSGMIAMEYNLDPVFDTGVSEEEERDLKARPEIDAQDKQFLPSRPPVVTIMGHVDHGKTTILDYLRKSSVAAGEAGGITQHIGAFSVPLAASGKTITFLDTPGHAAFLAMRQRGANVTDIVILVVAADDSVKPQTLEAIKHAKAANVPMIVAVNKVDKEEADVQRVKQDLARHGVEIEDFGGETQVVLVSGKTGQGMDELEEATVTLSEILDHRAESTGAVEGWVLEATTKKAGRVATVLVRRGTLRQGAVIVAGKTWARVRSLRNEAGVAIDEASPGMPVEVDGWRDQPAAGDEVLQAPTEQKATSVVEYRLEVEEREKTAADMEAINEARRLEQEKREAEKRAEQAKTDGTEPQIPANPAPAIEQSSGPQEIPFIIKADVSGSAEAVSAYILSISSPLIYPKILHSSVGQINESEIELASAAEGHIIAFNLPTNEGMNAMAKERGVQVLENNIIYRVLDDVKAVLEEKLPPIVTQRVIGEADVAAGFEISLSGRKKMNIAGCKVRNGLISKGARVRVLRGGEKVYDGTITSLKNVKKDVTEMRKGTECGVGFSGWDGFETGDQVQTYEEKSERRRL